MVPKPVVQVPVAVLSGVEAVAPANVLAVATSILTLWQLNTLTIVAAAGPPVIKRGDPVMVEAGNDGFSITREGTAMADAAAGARFFVRVEEAKQPIQAVAIASGQARLPGWSQ